MKGSTLLITFPAAMILVLTAIRQGTGALYSGAGIEEPAAFELIFAVLWIWIIGWWLRKADWQSRTWAPYCLGLFLLTGWPLVLIYHLFKTRRLRALIPIGIFLGVCIGAIILGVMLGVVIRG
jgi:hypothetical protein